VSDFKSSEDQFLEFYDSKIINESRTTKKRHYRYFTDPKDANIVSDSRDTWYQEHQTDYHEIDYERVLVVEIPQNALSELSHMHERFYSRTGSSSEMARMIVEKEWQESDIRRRTPAVQAAWEQYSLLLHLASTGKDIT
jgi:hypothetical protein